MTDSAAFLSHPAATLQASLDPGQAIGQELIHIHAPSVIRRTIETLAPALQASTGQTLAMHYGGTGLQLAELAAGACADLIVLPLAALESLARQGQIHADIQLLGCTAMGVARANTTMAPACDVASPDALRRTLLSARRIAVIAPGNSTSSNHVTHVFDTLGITAAIGSKLLLIRQGYVADYIAAGEADIGIQQIPEILAVPGVTLAGPLPAPLQRTTAYAMAVARSSQQAHAARHLRRCLTTPFALSLLAAHGFLLPWHGSRESASPLTPAALSSPQ